MPRPSFLDCGESLSVVAEAVGSNKKAMKVLTQALRDGVVNARGKRPITGLDRLNNDTARRTFEVIQRDFWDDVSPNLRHWTASDITSDDGIWQRRFVAVGLKRSEVRRLAREKGSARKAKPGPSKPSANSLPARNRGRREGDAGVETRAEFVAQAYRGDIDPNSTVSAAYRKVAVALSGRGVEPLAQSSVEQFIARALELMRLPEDKPT